MAGHIAIVGLGPGSAELLTPDARHALEAADLIVGYHAYLNLLGPLTTGKETYGTGMLAEVERAAYAVQAARAGKRVAVIGSGDACVYGLGSLVLELLSPESEEATCSIHPGITAANAAAALLGAPLANDYMVLSLSDLLTERTRILRRLELAAQAGIALTLYNPRSSQRQDLFDQAVAILQSHRRPSNPAALVRLAYRPGQGYRICTLEDLAGLQDSIDMHTIVIIADDSSFIRGGRIITPRGYLI